MARECKLQTLLLDLTRDSGVLPSDIHKGGMRGRANDVDLTSRRIGKRSPLNSLEVRIIPVAEIEPARPGKESP